MCTLRLVHSLSLRVTANNFPKANIGIQVFSCVNTHADYICVCVYDICVCVYIYVYDIYSILNDIVFVSE